MKKAILSTAIAMILFVGTAQAGCEEPVDPPALPDGATASETQMLDAQKSVKDYVFAMNEYLACLAPEGKPGEVDVESYNKSAERMEEFVASFNMQLRVFKSRW